MVKHMVRCPKFKSSEYSASVFPLSYFQDLMDSKNMKRHRPKVIYSAAFVIAKAGNNPNVYFLG
jgi:hypothetical protein